MAEPGRVTPPLARRFAFPPVPKRECEPVIVALDNDIKSYTNANKVCGTPPWKDIKHHFQDEQTMLDWLLEEEILTAPDTCPVCSSALRPPDSRGLVRCFECRKDTGSEWSQSVYKDTFFEDCRRGRHELMEFLYNWLCGASAGFQRKHLGWSNKKVSSWTKHLQDLIAECVLCDDVQIGGENIVVEIDEAKFGKRKHHRGHRVEGAWVFGGVECTPERRFFAVIVEQRDKATLMPLIRKFIAPGSIIISDEWGAYNDIAQQEGMNYTHETVCHKKTFRNPETGACTNTIEGTWSGMKASIPARLRHKKQLQACLFEFIWRRNNEGNLWNGLLSALKEVRCVN